MGRNKKYNTPEEAKEAIKIQKKNYIERIGIENYRQMVRVKSLIHYHKYKVLHPKPIVIKDEVYLLKKKQLQEKVIELNNIIKEIKLKLN